MRMLRLWRWIPEHKVKWISQDFPGSLMPDMEIFTKQVS